MLSLTDYSPQIPGMHLAVQPHGAHLWHVMSSVLPAHAALQRGRA